MRIINNRYKIIRRLEENHFVSRFLVEDLLDDHQKMDLYLFESYLFSEESFEFLKYYFSFINSLPDIFFQRVVDFSPVVNMNGVKKNASLFFYCTAHLEHCSSLFEWISNGGFGALIKTVGSILQMINYSGLRGFTYSSFKPEDLYFEHSGESVLRHRDLIYKEFEFIHNGLYDKNFDKNSIQNDWSKWSIDLKELACMLLSVVEGSSTIREDQFDLRCAEISLEPYFSSAWNEYEKYQDLIAFIRELYNGAWSSNFEDFHVIYSDFARRFSLSPAVEEFDQFGLLSKNALLIGRDFHMRMVKELSSCANDSGKDLSSRVNDSNGVNVVLAFGEAGMGKTKFLHELEHLYKLENIMYISSYRSSKEEPNSVLEDIYHAYLNIFNSLYFGEKRRAHLEKLDELKKNFFVDAKEDNSHIDFRTILQTTNMLLNATRSDKLVFLIDNIEFLNDRTLDSILYFLTDSYLREKLLFIFTINPKNLSSNDGASRFINLLKSMKITRDLQLEPLNYNETNLMIKSILFCIKNSDKLAYRIFSESLGNPDMIIKLIKEYVFKGYLLLNRIQGFWEFKERSLYLDSDDIKFNSSFYSEYLRNFTIEQMDILCVLSCFHEVVSVESLSKISDYSVEEINTYLDKYHALGIVEIFYEGSKKLIRITNASIKSVLYKSLSKEERMEYHKGILELLNEEFESDVKEILSQYRALEYFDRGRELAVKLAKMRSYNPQSAIRYYKIALDFVVEDQNDIEAQIRLELSKNYIFSGQLQLASQTLDEILPFYEKILDFEIKERLIYQKLKLASISGDYDSLLKCIELLENYEHRATRNMSIIRMLLEATRFVFEGENEKAFQVYSDIIVKYHDHPNFNGYIAECYRMMGKTSGGFVSDEERLRLLNIALMISEKIGDTFHSLIINGNMSYIYLVNLHEYDKAIGILTENLKLAQRKMYIIIEIFAMNNIGYTYMMQGDYKRASDFLRKAFIRSEIAGINIQKVEILVELFRCYLRFKDFKSILKTWNEYNHFIEEIKYTNENYKFIIFLSDYYFSLGDYETSMAYIEQLFDESSNLPEVFKPHWQYIYRLLQMIISKQYDEKLILDYVIELDTKNDDFADQDSCYRYCRYMEIIIHTFGLEKTLNILKNIQFYEIRSKSNLTKMYFEYFRAITTVDHKIKKLEQLFLCEYFLREYPNEALGITIHYEIAKEIYSSEYENESILYMYEALVNVIKIIKALPEKYLHCYFHANKFSRIFIFFENFIYDKNRFVFEEDENVVIETTYIKELLSRFTDKLLVSDSKFIDLIIHEKLRYGGFEQSLKGVVQGIGLNRKENIKHLLEYFALKILSTEAFILLNDGFDNYEIFTTFSHKVSNVDHRVLIKYLDTKSVNMESGSGLIKEYPEITQIVSFPIFDNKIGRTRKIKGFIVFLSESDIHVFENKVVESYTSGIGLLSAMINGYELKSSVSIDRLTGALTRKYLFDELNALFTSETSNPATIAIMDLDGFKKVNDTYGHQVGDLVLKNVIKTALRFLPAKYKIGRYGGEEFLLIFRDLDEKNAISICQKLRKEIEKLRFHAYPELSITVSMGLKQLDRSEDMSVENWIEKADSALYFAKRSGRNRCVLFRHQIEEHELSLNPIRGILIGDEIRDSRVMMTLTELVLLKRKNRLFEENLQDIMNRSMEILGVREGGVVLVSHQKIIQAFYKNKGKNTFSNENHLDESILQRLIQNEKYISEVDWNDLSESTIEAKMPIWNYVLAIRIVRHQEIKGILYYKAPYHNKKYDDGDLNFANMIANIISMYLNQEGLYEKDQQTV